MGPTERTRLTPLAPAAAGAARRSSRPGPATLEPIRVCPNCGATLTERKCKLVCPEPRCGYFLSCADYY